ncbi:hypothetical protein, partial [Acinetobacter nosocomialis]|uniref:hypothetical protein n=1 Tax=Acinetobacter nosocomialis TaxID=106654 RepID=UPI0013CFE06F
GRSALTQSLAPPAPHRETTRGASLPAEAACGWPWHAVAMIRRIHAPGVAADFALQQTAPDRSSDRKDSTAPG